MILQKDKASDEAVWMELRQLKTELWKLDAEQERKQLLFFVLGAVVGACIIIAAFAA